jgi:streptogramin lyase
MRGVVGLVGVVGMVASAGCDAASSNGSPAPFCPVVAPAEARAPVPTQSCAPFNLIVAASDYSSSALGVLAIDGGMAFGASAALGADPALAASHGRVFWINRTLGSIIELDPKCNTVIGGPWLANDPGTTNATGGSNPQDVAVAPDGSLWVARLDEPSILILSADGASQQCRVDLSTVTGPRVNPYMSSIRIISNPAVDQGAAKAYVTLEMLTVEPGGDEVPLGPSYLARIDVATQRIEAHLELKGRNPFGLMVEYEGALYLAEPGSWSDARETNAGIEMVDLASFTSELLLKESDIGASVAQVSINGSCLTAIVADPSSYNYTSLISFDTNTGSIVTPLSQRFLYSTAGYELEGMAWLDGGINVVGDRTAVDGKGYAVHVLEASASCTLKERSTSLYVPQEPIAFQPTP